MRSSRPGLRECFTQSSLWTVLRTTGPARVWLPRSAERERSA